MKHTFAKKSLSVLLSLLMLMSVIGGMSLTASATGGWSIAALQTGDAYGTPTITEEDGVQVLTYTNLVADYVLKNQDGVDRPIDAWWIGAKFIAPSDEIAATAQVTIGGGDARDSYIDPMDNLNEGAAVRAVWIGFTDTGIRKALNENRNISVSFKFYNSAESVTPDAEMKLVLDVSNVTLTKGVVGLPTPDNETLADAEVVLETEAGALKTWKGRDYSWRAAAHPITPDATVEGNTVTFSNFDVNFVSNDDGIDRPENYWWFGVKFYAPDETLIGTATYGDHSVIGDDAWWDEDTDNPWVGQWFGVNREGVKTALAENGGIKSFTYTIYDNAEDTVGTTFTINIDLNNATLSLNGDPYIVTENGAIKEWEGEDYKWTIAPHEMNAYGVVDGNKVTFSNFTTNYVDNNDGIERPTECWWLGVKIYAPDAALVATATDKNGDLIAPWYDTNTDSPWFGAWFGITEANLKKALAETDGILTYTYKVYNNANDQDGTTFTIEIDLNDVTLTKNSKAWMKTEAGELWEAANVGTLNATYGDLLSSVALPENWAWDAAEDATVGNAGTNTVQAQFAGSYPVGLTITVAKATPTVTTWPTATLTYGQTLAQATLTGGEASVPGTFVFTAAATKPTVAQSGTSYEIKFVPTDSANYNVVEGGTAAVTVSKAAPTVTAPKGLTLDYNSDTQTLISAGSAVGGTMLYSMTADGEYTEKLPSAKAKGTYQVYYKVIGDEHHTDTEPASVKAEIVPTAIERFFKSVLDFFNRILKAILPFAGLINSK